jgi:hypothetical protein
MFWDVGWVEMIETGFGIVRTLDYIEGELVN